MRELSSEFQEISSELEASLLIRTIGSSHEGPVKTLIAYAAKRLGWKQSRAKHVWYQNARTIKSEEMDRLRELADRESHQRAVSAVVALRRAMAKTSAERHGEIIGHLDRALLKLGAEVCAVDDSEPEGER